MLRSFYLGAAAAILLVYTTPALNRRFLAYGARVGISTTSIRKSSTRPAEPGILARTDSILDQLAKLQVPHSWFLHFYVSSVVSSIIWLQQLVGRGFLFRMIANRTAGKENSTSVYQVALCWSLILVQGARRLYECVVLAKPSKSQMWAGHWLLGIMFYVATGICVWIEGLVALQEPSRVISLSTPSLRTMIFLPIFLIASGVQHDTHVYLASLKKYTLAAHPAFTHIICPHYAAECVIYITLTVLAAPSGLPVNGTLFCALIFVVVNLGVSADVSKEWAIGKFGRERVQGKWRMIPGVW